MSLSIVPELQRRGVVRVVITYLEAVLDRYRGRSIAVLPFVNRSSEPEQVFCSDAIAEDVLNLLSRVRELRGIKFSAALAVQIVGRPGIRTFRKVRNLA